MRINVTHSFGLVLMLGSIACGAMGGESSAELSFDGDEQALSNDSVYFDFEWEDGNLVEPMSSTNGQISTARTYRGSAEVKILIPVAGEWRLSFRGLNDTNGKSAFRVSGSETRFNRSVPKTSSFSRQVNLSKKDFSAPGFSRTGLDIHLAAGEQSLRVDKMHSGLRLDSGRMVLVAAAKIQPTEEEDASPAEEPPVNSPVVDFDPERPWEDLLERRVGFGSSAVGGAGGELCVVDSLEDSGTGSLRACAARSSKGNTPVWVVFDVDGSITLDSPLRLGSNTTIDGRGARIRVRRHGLSISRDANVVIHNIEISDINGTGDSDALSVYASSDVWVDHVSFSNSTDGLLDITKGSREVTVSWCRFEDQNKTMLIGANPNHLEDKGTR
ncbi:MAG: hypothetical protein AAFQ82_13315, partial [Myxococcota bacterium]